MMSLIIEELTAKSFSPFGTVLSNLNLESVPESDEYSWSETGSGIELSPLCCTGMLNCRKREMVLNKMECHMNTSEVLFSVQGDSILCVAPTSADGVNEQDVHAFLLPQGQAIVMKTATWHWIPYPLNEEGAQILVLFRDNTGGDDLNFIDLKNQLIIN